MLNRTILIFVFLLAIASNTFAAAFVVTSNADSGPGTLREALTLAANNGNVSVDYINFNLPDLSIAGRTITLSSNLPVISSDLIIDGSTQPGSSLSVNGAKVIIGGNYLATNSSYINYFLIQSVNQFEMYGLIIKSLSSGPYNNLMGVQPIIIDGHNKTIIFGQPGKGNVIYNCSEAIECAVGEGFYFPNKSSTDNVILKNNFLGVKEDGISTDAISGSSQLLLNYVSNIALGGDTKAEGNIIYGIAALSPSYGTDNLSKDATIAIKNNIFGVNSLQQVTNSNIANYLSIGVNPNNTYNNSTSVLINDNVFGYGISVTGFQLLTMQVQHNFFGVSSDQQNILSVKASALSLGYMQGTIQIGGDDVSKGNIFAHCAQDSNATFYSPGIVNVSTFSSVIDPLFKVELSHNSFYCNNSPPFMYYLAPDKKPFSVTIDNLTATSATGTTRPNARVELFYTDKECTQCQPKTFITTTYADANGKWIYNGSLLPGYGVMAGATLNQVSSEFTDTRVYAYAPYMHVTYAECGNNGKIEGALVVNAKNIQWLNSSNKVVGTTANLEDVGPGKYVLRAEQFGCVIYSDSILVADITPKAYDQFKHIANPACGKGGSITGLYTVATIKTQWVDGNGKVISDQLDVSNLSAGSYTLQMTGQRGCVQTYGPITLTYVSGPNIDQSSAVIQFTNCGQSTGSITNLNVTGAGILKYIWWNSQQQTVGTTKDLLNQPAGAYKLQVTDDSQCGSVYTTDIIIPETNGIVLDESNAQITVASCNNNNGSVTGIKVTGATQYQWTDANNKVIAATEDLQNMSPGDYILTASNSFGCSKTSKSYSIGQQPPTKFPNYTNSIVPACYQATNGAVTVATDALVKSLRWVNSQGQTVGTDPALTNAGAGTYLLYLTDKNGCENYYETYTVGELPEYKIVSPGVITNDQCNLGIGSISSADIEGGIQPYKYTWYNSTNQQIGTGSSISNLTAGTYVLNVISAGCGQSNTLYTVTNETKDIPPPDISDVYLCSSGNALLTVKNPTSSATYRLYNDPNTSQPLDEQKGGKFKVNVVGNTSYYVSQLNGSCESSRSKVNIEVGLSAINIANTFTPNGDGINDYWKIAGIENYPNALVQVFTRYGQKVFESRGYLSPFNGTWNGQTLPSGVYYYIINLETNCSLLNGSITIIR